MKMKNLTFAILGLSSSIFVSTPSSAQLYNGYGGGSYFGGGNTTPPERVIQRGNGHGSGDYFGSPSTTPSRINNSPSSPGLIKLRDCSKYIDC